MVTLTQQADKVAIVRQLLRTDVEQVGSAGGGLQQCQITQLFGADYFGVKLWNGSSVSGSQFLVSRSYVSRMGFGAGYSYTSTGENSRTSDDGSGTTAINPELQVMDPPFTVGDVVSVVAIDHTGVTVSGTELKLIEVNTKRGWAHQAGTAQVSGVWVLTP